MAQGDITKEIEYDKIEVVNTWNIQVRQATKIMEEQEDGSKVETVRGNIFRDTILPFVSTRDSDDNWVHTDTDVSGKDSRIQAICNAAWTDDMKNAYKDWAKDKVTL